MMKNESGGDLSLILPASGFNRPDSPAEAMVKYEQKASEPRVDLQDSSLAEVTACH